MFRPLKPLVLFAALALSATAVIAETPVSLLDGRLTFTLPPNFKKSADAEGALAGFEASDGGEWMLVSLAKTPLPEGGLAAWMQRKKAAYATGMPPEIRPHMRWLKQKMIKREGVQWADLRFDCAPEGGQGPGVLYTRFFATTVDGKLLELTFCGNLSNNLKRRAMLDKIADSAVLRPAAGAGQ